jgi:hypothetical protein
MMQYEMQNFIKMTKAKLGDEPKPKRDDWKRSRKVARDNKLQMQRGTTNFKSKRIA